MKKLLVAMLLVGGVCGSVKAEEELSSGDGRIYPIVRTDVNEAPSPEGHSRYRVAGKGQDTFLILQKIASQLKTLIKNFPASLTKKLTNKEQLFLKNSLKNLNNMFPEKTVLGRDPRTWSPGLSNPEGYGPMKPIGYYSRELEGMEAGASKASKKAFKRSKR